MFASLKLRLATLFVLLSLFTFALLTLLAMWLFHMGMTAALDEELQGMAAACLPNVGVQAGVPTLSRLSAGTRKEIEHNIATVQLYDRDGVLLEQYGPEGVPGLADSRTEKKAAAYSMRVLSVPLVRDGVLVGYLQLEHPTKNRDHATRHFGLAVCLTAPLLIVCLGASGYLFAQRAVRPVEEAMRALRQFMADAGHELGTPISIIQANAEALDEELAEHGLDPVRTEVITRSTERMSNLVNDLMVLAKTTSPRLLWQPVTVSFHELVGSTVLEFSQLFKEKNIALQVDALPECSLLGSPESLKKMISNLLSNALRYTDSGGTVTVSLFNEGRHARLEVRDTGIGIPEESIAHIFDRFYRVEKSRARAAGGSGLGLAIVKAVVDAHHGKIEVDSKVGHGTRFSVTLPLRGAGR